MKKTFCGLIYPFLYRFDYNYLTGIVIKTRECCVEKLFSYFLFWVEVEWSVSLMQTNSEKYNEKYVMKNW